MILRWLMAAVHLIALGVGLGSVWVRGRALGGSPDDGAVRRALAADTGWESPRLLWISTGLDPARSGASSKGTQYYLQNHVFWTKMVLLLVILALECGRSVTLMRWRIQIARGRRPDDELSTGDRAHQPRAGGARRADGARRHGDGARGIGGR